MVEFICIGIVELCSTPNKWEFWNENFLPTVRSYPTTSRLLDRHVIHCAMQSIYRFTIKGNIYAHILQKIKTNQWKGGDIMNFNLHMMKYCDLKVTPNVFLQRYRQSSTRDRPIRMYMYFIVYYIVFVMRNNLQWSIAKIHDLYSYFTLQYMYMLKQSNWFDQTKWLAVYRSILILI